MLPTYLTAGASHLAVSCCRQDTTSLSSRVASVALNVLNGMQLVTSSSASHRSCTPNLWCCGIWLGSTPATCKQSCPCTSSFYIMAGCREAGMPVHMLSKDEKAQLLKVMHALLWWPWSLLSYRPHT